MRTLEIKPLPHDMGSGRLFFLKSILRGFWPPSAKYLPKDYPDLTGKVAFVTGASTGVGLCATKLLVSKNCHVFIGVRNETKAKAAIERIVKELGDNDGNPIGQIDIVVLDLADLTTIRSGAEQLLSKTDKLNIIIHNAGVMASPPSSKTAEGYDLQFGTNVIGPFFLQKLIDPLFLKPDTVFKRLVWVTSVGHNFSPPGGINWDDLGYDKDVKNIMGAYGQSKAGDIILSGVWPQKHPKEVAKQNIVSVAVHPGQLRTELSRERTFPASLLTRLTHFDPVYGAYTELFGLLSPELTYKDNGAYIVPWGEIGESRDDVRESITNGNGDRLWNFLWKETSNF